MKGPSGLIEKEDGIVKEPVEMNAGLIDQEQRADFFDVFTGA
jgi:hypothetical protein